MDTMLLSSSASYHMPSRMWFLFCVCSALLHTALSFTPLRTKVRTQARLHTTTCVPSPLESSHPPNSPRCTNARYLEEATKNGFPIPTSPSKTTSTTATTTSRKGIQVLMKEGNSESNQEENVFSRCTDNDSGSDNYVKEESADDDDRCEDDDTEETDPLSKQKRREIVTRAALLGCFNRSRSPPSSRGASKEKQTSVGTRRTGSATRAKEQPGSASKLMDALRKAARGASAQDKIDQQQEGEDASQTTSLLSSTESFKNDYRSTDGSSSITGSTTTSQLSKVSASDIHSAIGELLTVNFAKSVQAQPGRFQAAVSSLKKSVGISDETLLHHRPAMSAPMTLSADGTVTRLANPMDDLDIANLRLSVFSGFSFDQQGQFCTRSCQAIANRRKRGAVCIVATKGAHTNPRIYGTAECSFHEFHGTRLGQRRPRSSILYVTEVAVHPSFRRKGIGSMLLEAIDIYADRRRIETVYLHVDVCNFEALGLYGKSGYRVADPSESIFEEFTKSLNLHPGATKGRNHHLLYKDISVATWLPQDMFVNEPHRVVGQLGFEIPA